MKVRSVYEVFKGEIFEDCSNGFNLTGIFSADSSHVSRQSPTAEGTTFLTPIRSTGSSLQKSPFSLSFINEISPITSPRSSTPVLGDITFTKSFETPSFHSPISSETSHQSNRYGLVSDTVVSWNEELETPAHYLETPPPRPLLSKHTKAQTAKKLFESPGIEKTQQITDVQNNHLQKENVAPACNPQSNSLNLLDQSNKEHLHYPKTSFVNIVTPGKSDKESGTPTDKIEKDNFAQPNRSENDTCVESNQMKDGNSDGECDLVSDCCKSKVLDNFSVLENSSSQLEQSDKESNTTRNQLKTIDTLADKKNNQRGPLSSPQDSLPLDSLNTTGAIQPHQASKQFQYPVSTQRPDIDIEFSQWPDELYKHVDDLVLAEQTSNKNVMGSNKGDASQVLEPTQWPNDFDTLEINAAVEEIEKELKDSEKGVDEVIVKGSEETIAGGVQEQHDSLEFSQWPEDVCAKIDEAVAAVEADLKNSKPAKKPKSISERIELLGQIETKKSVFLDEDFSDLETISSVSKPVLNSGFFKEDFSDLKLNSDLVSFKSASAFKSSMAAKVPRIQKPKITPKDTSSFFNEDFSDLDLSKIPSGFANTGFVISSKVIGKKVKARPNNVHSPNKQSDCSTKAHDSDEKPTPIKFAGFSTAGGSKIEVSEETLKFIKSSQAQQISKVSNADDIGTSKQKMTGFATAGGKKVSVSKKSMDHIKSSQLPSTQSMPSLGTSNKFGFFNEDFSDIDMSKIPAEFANAGFINSSKVISDIKKKDLEVDDIPSISEQKDSEKKLRLTDKKSCSMKFVGFSTAGGSKIEVSEKSLNFIKSSQAPQISELSITDDISASEAPSRQKMTGFATAGGKKVSVSKTSMDHIKSSQLPSSQSMPGFVRAGGKKMEASDSALDTFQTSQLPSPDDPTNMPKVLDNTNQIDIPKVLKSVGFSTAAGSKVNVSRDSLDFVRSSQVPRNFPDAHTTPTRSVLKNTKRSLPLLPAEHPPKQSRRATSYPITKATTPPQSDVINRLRRRSTDETSPLALNKRRRVSRRTGFHSPVTDKTRGMVSSPISHRTRPGFSPLLCSPKLESTLEEEPPSEQTNFVTPYNKQPGVEEDVKPSTEDKKSAPSVMWQHNFDKLTAKKFIKPSDGISTKQPLQCLPPPVRHTNKQLYELGVSHGVEAVTASSAQHFVFRRPHFFSDSQTASLMLAGSNVELHLVKDSAGVDEFYAALLSVPHIKKQSVTREWVANHYRWVVWKCAGQERTQPSVFAGRALTPDSVMSQLLQRYNVEIEEGKRSALRKITEKDDSAGKPLTLLISGINNIEKTVEVSDGWYCLDCQIDMPLTVLVQRKVISVGDKITSFSSGIIGAHNDGIPPLQAKGMIKLKMNYNAVRPAQWHAKLGYADVSVMPILPLKVLSGDGGMCTCVCVVIVRRYPIQYMETVGEGKKEFLSAKQESRRQQEYEKKREKIMEELAERVACGAAGGGTKKIDKAALRKLETGQELYDTLQQYPDPGSLHHLLSSQQLTLLREFTEREQSRASERRNKQLMEQLEERCPRRKVISLVKYKIQCNSEGATRSHLTVWRAEHQDALKEGRCYKIYNVACSAYGGRAMCLSSVKGTQYRELPGDFSAISYKPVCTVSSIPLGTQECDLLGRVLQVEDTEKDTVFVMADTVVCKQVTLRGNLTNQELSEVVKPGNHLFITNMMISRQGKLYVNEKSTLTTSPKDSCQASRLRDFTKSLSSKSETFWEGLLKAKNTCESVPDEQLIEECPEQPPLEIYETPNKPTFSTPNQPARDRFSTPKILDQSIPLFSKKSSLNVSSSSLNVSSSSLNVSSSSLVDLPELPCSTRAKNDFVTPVKPADYRDIFS